MRVLWQALINNGIPVTGVQLLELNSQAVGSAQESVNMSVAPYEIVCHDTCATCIKEGRDGCILCKDGFVTLATPYDLYRISCTLHPTPYALHPQLP